MITALLLVGAIALSVIAITVGIRLVHGDWWWVDRPGHYSYDPSDF